MIRRYPTRLTRVAPLAAAGLLALASWSCPGPTPPPAAEPGPGADEMSSRSDEGAVIAAHRSLIQAFQAADVESIVALLDPTPELLIFHPILENRFDGPQEAREGLTRMFERLGALEWTEVHPQIAIHGDIAIHTSQVLLKSATREEPFIGRGTEVWLRRGGEWALLHAHWSEHARLAGGVRG